VSEKLLYDCCGQFLAANCIPLLIQQSVDGYYSFNRSWAEFKVGFNDSRGNYWIGNDLLHQLTNEARYKLWCLLQPTSTRVVYVANYDTFLVGSESSNYMLRVAHYYGNAGDAMNYHSGMMFTTYDRDNDMHATGNCAQDHAGGFWHNICYTAGVTAMRKGSSGFFWSTLPTSNKQLDWATLLLTC